MVLLRHFVLHALSPNVLVTARHIRGKSYYLADKLSGFEFQAARRVAPFLDLEPFPPHSARKPCYRSLEYCGQSPYSLSISTRGTYARALRSFNHHCQTYHTGRPLPTTIPHVADFITFLHAQNYAPSTITTYVSALSFINKLYQAPDHADCFIIKKLLRGSRKLHQTPDTRQPIAHSLLLRHPGLTTTAKHSCT